MSHLFEKKFFVGLLELSIFFQMGFAQIMDLDQANCVWIGYRTDNIKVQIEDGNVLHIKGEGGKEEQHNGGWVSRVSGVIMFFDK